MGRILQFLGLEKRAAGFDELEAFLASARSTAAGVAVDPSTALRYAPVLASVKLISESVAQLPLLLFRRDGVGRQKVEDHPAEKLLTVLSNPWTVPFQLKADMTAELLLHGESFGLVARSSDGRPLEIIPLHHGAVCVEFGPDLAPIYRLTLPDGAQRLLAPSELLHIRGLSHGCRGPYHRPLSVVREASDAIGLGLALEKHAANIMKRGARPAGVVSTPSKLSQGAIERMRASIEAAHGGTNSGRTMVLEEGSTYSPLTFSSVDLQFQEMRAFQVLEVARIFRVPPSLIASMDKITHANAESLGQQFLSLTLSPVLQLWCEVLARDLLTEAERDAGYYFRFKTDALSMVELLPRIQAYAQAIGGALMTPDEARDAFDLPPVQGGDQLRLPLNTAGAADGAAPATGAANG
ncbi:phage portal protein [Nitrospirillum amazonense]|uniref:phage portal protein n=1 Tax=Nitrospirillum amazonense TaxID=28077 RepID=UPI002DD41E40|nr:phage portal protein [Nitrospirillum amazonense]MEC4590557.1 phage portal protein [Nitrospirillum amazonense]